MVITLLIFVCQGQKGESGLPGKSPRGVIKFEDTDENCTLSIAGTVRYSTIQKTLQLCDGNAWLEVLARKGHVPHNPGRHCLDLLNSGELWIEVRARVSCHVLITILKLKMIASN